MAPLPVAASADPTLDAIDAELVKRQHSETRREYLGMSAIGHPCARKLWYDMTRPDRETFDAATLKRFACGHRGEDIMAGRLRTVAGVTLITLDPDTGRQIGFQDHGGKFRGHADGGILGLLQAPETWAIWEHKATSEKNQAVLMKLKAAGEKSALQTWNPQYYAQAVLYMHYSGLTRHYLTCSTPGERATVSVRTDADPAHAAILRDKAERILNARAPLARISNDPNWYQCKWCWHQDHCHGTAP